MIEKARLKGETAVGVSWVTSWRTCVHEELDGGAGYKYAPSSCAGYIDESGGLNLAPEKADTQVWDEHTHLITIAEQP